MKVFISADIEGCCGVFSNIETHKNEAVYAPCKTDDKRGPSGLRGGP